MSRDDLRVILRHSSRTNNDGGKYAIGLEHEGKLVGVAIVGRGSR